MSIENDVKAAGIEETEFHPTPEVDVMPEVPQSTGFSLNLGWLRTPTGEGDIEDRITHPLNPFKSRGLAQMLRGFEGLLGNLKLAIVDIIIGAFNFIKERRENSGNTANTGDIQKSA